MTTVITRGAGSAQALGYAARATAANYIEDVFSTYLYTGTGASQTITNEVDLSTKGGMVWLKVRSGTTGDHEIFDTARGTTKRLMTNSTSSEITNANTLTAFNSNGFSIGNYSEINGSGNGMASWTFRKQAKFFDVVTYTGNGANRTIAHNLGSVPGCIIVKRTDTTGNWSVYHRSLGGGTAPGTEVLFLNTTDTVSTVSSYWNDTTATSTVFSLGTTTAVNANGGTYVAYLFAHDAGGFGASGSDNVISCGSTGGGSSEITLGYEPQFLLYRVYDTTDDWHIIDNMRGASVGSPTYNMWSNLNANTSGAETSVTGSAGNPNIKFTATGFVLGAIPGNAIYIAIRRGPMRTPTSGTSVFKALSKEGNSSPLSSSPVGVVDLAIVKAPQWDIDTQTYTTGVNLFCDRLRGLNSSGYALALDSTTTSAEASASSSDVNPITSYARQAGLGLTVTNSLITNAYWLFRRAPGFFDEVCYTGTGSNTTQTHNLGVVPELIIVKRRSAAGAWSVYSSALSNTEYMVLNTTAAKATGATYWNSTTPTSSVFSIGTAADVNANTATYVAYLFATVAGVSKVGSYTGTGTTLQVNCGFTGGARFVLIKRTDSTGDWYVWDSARGIVAGNDPYLRLNSTAAEVTNTDYVDTYSAGFEISSTAPAAINANGGTFIFLAIA